MEISLLENIFITSNWDKTEEYIREIFKNQSFRVEKIISSGHILQKMGWYDQDENELVFLISGEASLEFEDCKIINMKAGDILQIHAHKKHRVIKTSTNPECVWIAVFWNK